MEFLAVAAVIGLLPAAIAKSKGYGFGLWWFYGAALFIIALPHALLLKPNQKALEVQAVAEGKKKCPFCAEMIFAEAGCVSTVVATCPPFDTRGAAA